MKTIPLSLFLAVLFLSASFIQDQFMFNPTGKWSYNAGPDAKPFDTGKVEITVAEGKHTVSISVPDTDIMVSADNIRFTGDSLFFSLNLVETSANVLLRMESADRMSGTVVTSSDDEIPVTLTRDE